MAEDLVFVDPAFTCQLFLTGAARALYEAAKPQFERLKGVLSLGLLAQIDDVAKHTRHQHLVGLMRIFDKLCQQPSGKGLPKGFLWSFWCRLCFAQTGHAALSYDSEKAVLLACHLDSTFKDELRAMLQPVISSLAACAKCSRSSCEVRDKGTVEAPVWFDDLVTGNRWRGLHLWVAALKLIQHPSVLAILRGQRTNDANLLGFSEADALKMMVAPNCEWRPVFRRLRRLDFIPRDLAFAGTINIRLDLDTLVSAANEPHRDWKLLASLNNYMVENIYESPELQLASTLYQRALATLLTKRKLSLGALFGFEPASATNDDELRAIVAKTLIGKQVFDHSVRKCWRVWPIHTYVDEKRAPVEVEKEVTGHAKAHLNRHVNARVTCVKLERPNLLGLAISHRDLNDKPNAKAFVKLCRSLLLKQIPRINEKEVANALYEGLVDRKCADGLEAAVKRLSKLGLPLDQLKKTAEIINDRANANSVAQGDVSIHVGGFAYRVPSERRQFIVNIMHAVIAGGGSAREILGFTPEDAAEVLWSELLRWQSLHFGLRCTKAFSNLLELAQHALAKQIVGGAPGAEADLEVYTLLEALKHPATSVSFRITLPNLRLIKDDGQHENEYDVVSVVLKDDKYVQVWVWGVTVEQNLSPKRAADLVKIQKLKDLLGQRWAGDVKVVTCYVHRDRNDICCEIDGSQTRRTINPLLTAAS